MNCLIIPPEIKRNVLEVLDRLPRPPVPMAGKVTVTFEFNVDAAGQIGMAFAETRTMREVLARGK